MAPQQQRCVRHHGEYVRGRRYPTADLAETVQLLGYEPVDDAWASG
jgi:hypothetical protein